MLHACRAVSEAELSILHLREEALQKLGSNRMRRLPSHAGSSGGCSKSLLHRDTLCHLSARGQSTVARTSLAARHRWEWALRRVLTVNRILKVFQESSLYSTS